LLAVVAVAKEVENMVKAAVRSARVEIHEMAAAGPIEGETLIMRGRIIPGADFEVFRMDSQLFGSLALRDGLLFEDFIEPTITFVRDQVVPRLEPFVEPS
jgi:hypothetical protein